MIIGAILQAASISYAMLVVARIITGVGNGLNVRNIHRSRLHLIVLRPQRYLPITLSVRQLKTEVPS